MLFVTVMLMGCDDGKPSNWDVQKGDWNCVASGTLTKYTKIRDCRCDCDVDDETKWCQADYIFSIDDEQNIIAGVLRDPGIIKVGSIGKLYKNEKGFQDKDSWFQWVETSPPESKKAPTEAIIEVISPPESKKVAVIEVKEEVIDGSWKRSNNINYLEIGTVVLVKLDDGIVTTAYLSEKKEWMLNSSKYKFKGGRPIENVSEWVNLNLN